MKLNWASLGIVALGGLLLVIAWEGTHTQVWDAIIGKTTSDTALNTSGAPFIPGTGNVIGVQPTPGSQCIGLTGTALRLCLKNAGIV